MKGLMLTVVALMLLWPSRLHSQADAREKTTIAVVEQLFVAMKSSDTATTRALFAGNARVIPVQSGGNAPSLGKGLSVDQFVAFVGNNAAGSWNERMWSPVERVNGALADLWFEYDVYHGTTLDHCGVNSVQLQRSSSGWKIISMAFTSVTDSCTKHPPSE